VAGWLVGWLAAFLWSDLIRSKSHRADAVLITASVFSDVCSGIRGETIIRLLVLEKKKETPRRESWT